MKKTTKARYFLTRHLFPCFVDGHFVFLDLNLDEYICLDQSRTEIFHTLFPNWTHRNDQKEPVRQDEAFTNAVVTLQKQGLLTQSRTDGKEAHPLNLNLPPLDLTGYDVDRKPDIRLSHICRFIKASLLTTAKLRFRSLQYIIERMKRRKLKGLKKTGQNGAISDPDLARDLVETFKTLKPLAFTSKNHCLFESLSLIEFLSYYGIFPECVFGIKLKPFAAHCWIQDKNFIYNDSLDYVARLTPIMVV